MMEIRKTEAYAKWFDGLSDLRARARILVRIERLGERQMAFYRTTDF